MLRWLFEQVKRKRHEQGESTSAGSGMKSPTAAAATTAAVAAGQHYRSTGSGRASRRHTAQGGSLVDIGNSSPVTIPRLLPPPRAANNARMSGSIVGGSFLSGHHRRGSRDSLGGALGQEVAASSSVGSLPAAPSSSVETPRFSSFPLLEAAMKGVSARNSQGKPIFDREAAARLSSSS
jgi:hypothetical protein